MVQFIIEYWVQALFGILFGAICGWCGRISVIMKHRNEEHEALKSGVIAILHDRLFQICNQYLALGYIPVDDAEEIMDNVKIVYDAYHSLGGNGTGTEIYNKFKKLHVKKGEGTND